MRILKNTVAALAIAVGAWTAGNAAAQCADLAAAAIDVPFANEVAADTGAVYLSVVGGDTPTPNDCGLNPSNDGAEWAGWGGPLETDNASIGEGPGTRNFVTIAETRYARGIGTHAAAVFTFDLSGGDYMGFAGFVGMDHEKSLNLAAPDCDHGGSSGFIFSVDGTEVFDSGTIVAVVDGALTAPVEVKFDIGPDAGELMITVTDGGDGASCDHSAIGDPKLLTSSSTAVDPREKTATMWGAIKRL